MEVVSEKPLVIVDFAHTPDGMDKVMDSLKDKDISVVFGAGGDRDNSKRIQMGRVADRYAKKIYLTNDNPRSEDPLKILEEHLKVAKEEGVKYVYVGNLPGSKWENTYCPKCGKAVIKRYGFYVYEVNLTKDGRCKFCGEKIFIKGNAKKSLLSEPRPIILDKPLVRVKISNGKVEKEYEE
jgi:DNA-directed RNA polymerase subunit RPC12/RpoP